MPDPLTTDNVLELFPDDPPATKKQIRAAERRADRAEAAVIRSIERAHRAQEELTRLVDSTTGDS